LQGQCRRRGPDFGVVRAVGRRNGPVGAKRLSLGGPSQVRGVLSFGHCPGSRICRTSESKREATVPLRVGSVAFRSGPTASLRAQQRPTGFTGVYSARVTLKPVRAKGLARRPQRGTCSCPGLGCRQRGTCTRKGGSPVWLSAGAGGRARATRCRHSRMGSLQQARRRGCQSRMASRDISQTDWPFEHESTALALEATCCDTLHGCLSKRHSACS
jgi:hypothetical protein